MMIDPPIGFDSTFIDWLDQAQDELHVRFIDRGGLTEEQIGELQAVFSHLLPYQAPSQSIF